MCSRPSFMWYMSYAITTYSPHWCNCQLHVAVFVTPHYRHTKGNGAIAAVTAIEYLYLLLIGSMHCLNLHLVLCYTDCDHLCLFFSQSP